MVPGNDGNADSPGNPDEVTDEVEAALAGGSSEDIIAEAVVTAKPDAALIAKVEMEVEKLSPCDGDVIVLRGEPAADGSVIDDQTFHELCKVLGSGGRKLTVLCLDKSFDLAQMGEAEMNKSGWWRKHDVRADPADSPASLRMPAGPAPGLGYKGPPTREQVLANMMKAWPDFENAGTGELNRIRIQLETGLAGAERVGVQMVGCREMLDIINERLRGPKETTDGDADSQGG